MLKTGGEDMHTASLATKTKSREDQITDEAWCLLNILVIQQIVT